METRFGTRISDERKNRDKLLHHNKDLFDENQDRRDLNESTGKPWNDSGGIGNDEYMRVVPHSFVITYRDECAGDAADRWLKEYEAKIRKSQ